MGPDLKGKGCSIIQTFPVGEMCPNLGRLVRKVAKSHEIQTCNTKDTNGNHVAIDEIWTLFCPEVVE